MSTVAQPLRFTLSSGACEALKWLALVAMLVDHVNTAFFDHAVGWMIPVGRFAMPVFVLLLGYNMARPGADLARLLRRLVLVGLVAQPFHAVALCGGSWLPLNVLWTFAAAVAVVMLVDRRQWSTAGAVALLACVLVDYSVVGVGALVVACLHFRTRSAGSLLALALSMAALCAWNGNLYALAGVLAFVVAGTWTLHVPRIRWAFWVAYPAHLALLAVLVMASSSALT